jgi:hypothetical protein
MHLHLSIALATLASTRIRCVSCPPVLKEVELGTATPLNLNPISVYLLVAPPEILSC